MTSHSTIDLLRHLAGKPGHDEVKADFRDLLIGEFGAELSALDFERRVPVVRGRLDALIGRTILEAKRDLAKELADVERKMPGYLGDREREEGEKFVGIAADGRQWIAYELEDGKLIKIKEIILDLQKPELFLAWLDGVVEQPAMPDAHPAHGQNPSLRTEPGHARFPILVRDFRHGQQPRDCQGPDRADNSLLA